MKHISILVPEGAILGSIEGPHKVFREMNDFVMSMGKPALFKVQLVGLSKEVKLNDGCFSVHPDLLIKDINKLIWSLFLLSMEICKNHLR